MVYLVPIVPRLAPWCIGGVPQIPPLAGECGIAVMTTGYGEKKYCPHRLAWSRTRAFQACDTGSNPVGDASLTAGSPAS